MRGGFLLTSTTASSAGHALPKEFSEIGIQTDMSFNNHEFQRYMSAMEIALDDTRSLPPIAEYDHCAPDDGIGSQGGGQYTSEDSVANTPIQEEDTSFQGLSS